MVVIIVDSQSLSMTQETGRHCGILMTHWEALRKELGCQNAQTSLGVSGAAW